MNWTFTRTATFIEADQLTVPLLPAVEVSNGEESRIYSYTKDTPFTWSYMNWTADPNADPPTFTGRLIDSGFEWSTSRNYYYEYDTSNPDSYVTRRNNGTVRFTGSIQLSLQENGKYTKSVDKDEEGEVIWTFNRPPDLVVGGRLSEMDDYNGMYTETDVDLDLSFDRPESFSGLIRELWSPSSPATEYIYRDFNPGTGTLGATSGAGFIKSIPDIYYIDPTAFDLGTRSLSIQANKDQIGIGQDHQLVLDIKGDIQGSTTDAVDSLEVRIPKGFVIKESTGLGSLVSQVVDTSGNGDTILTYKVANSSSSSQINGKVTVEATGLSQPEDKPYDYQWTSNFSAALKAPDGSSANPNNASESVLVDSSKGLAERLAGRSINNLQSFIDTLNPAVSNQIGQIPELLYPAYQETRRYINETRRQGIAIEDAIKPIPSNIRQGFRSVVKQSVRTFGNTLEKNFTTYVEKQADIVAKSIGKGIFPGLFNAYEEQIQRFSVLGFSYEPGVIRFSSSTDTSRFDLNLSIGRPEDLSPALIRAGQSGSLAPIRNWSNSIAEQSSLGLSFFGNQKNTKTNVTFGLSQGLGTFGLGGSISFSNDTVILEGAVDNFRIDRLDSIFDPKSGSQYKLRLRLPIDKPSQNQLSPMRLMEDSVSPFSNVVQPLESETVSGTLETNTVDITTTNLNLASSPANDPLISGGVQTSTPTGENIEDPTFSIVEEFTGSNIIDQTSSSPTLIDVSLEIPSVFPSNETTNSI